MKTVGEDGWFVYFRLYAPAAALLRQDSWVLSDIERVS